MWLLSAACVHVAVEIVALDFIFIAFLLFICSLVKTVSEILGAIGTIIADSGIGVLVVNIVAVVGGVTSGVSFGGLSDVELIELFFSNSFRCCC